MTCLKCNGNRVVWVTDRTWGTATCGPCPRCNKNGQQVKKDYDVILKKLKAVK